MRAIVTGANRGIGLALVTALAARGDRVTGTARATPPRVPGVTWRQVDVTDPPSLAALAAKDSAPLDLLVCNAGVLLDRTTGPLADRWAETLAVNVTGVALTVEAMLPALRAAKGKIAIIGSKMGSATLAPGGHLLYRASKAAALNLGRNLAADLAGMGIAVGIYHPGWVQTDMGSAGADITPQASAAGLIVRFDALTLANTGCFENWEGTAIPF